MPHWYTALPSVLYSTHTHAHQDVWEQNLWPKPSLHVKNTTFYNSSHFKTIYKVLRICALCMDDECSRSPAAGPDAPPGNWGLWFRWLFEGIGPRLRWVFWAWVTIWGSKQVIYWHMIVVLGHASCWMKNSLVCSSLVASFLIYSFSVFFVDADCRKTS